MVSRVGRQLDPSRIDHDQSGATANSLLDARAHDGVILSRVRPADQDRASQLDVVERAGGKPGAHRPLQSSGARRVTHSSAAVDVVGADEYPGKLLGEVGFFIRRAGRP